MCDFIKELKLLDDNSSLFNQNDKYIVPLYQRAYSWTEKEIEQLIDDINDFTDSSYYLGSLIVNYRNNNKYEVIDGQQRLTTLYILFKVLKLNTFDCLSFECRKKSNYTLKHLLDIDVKDDLIESNIIVGKKIIEEKLNTFNQQEFLKFKDKLKKILIYRIPVPKHTDLNRYFEIMNTRGEQLEQHDILKANLMSNLKTHDERNAFAMIWDACADMTGYVQMHFPRNIRDDLFGMEWPKIDCDIFDKIKNKKYDELKNESSVLEIIKPSFTDSVDGVNDRDEKVRFESIIDFPYFLQHVLKVLVKEEKIDSSDPDDKIVKDLLDDKKLIETFDYVLKNGKINNVSIDKHVFSVLFIKYLIKCRFLFDKYIIKREYSLNDSEGIWSIKTLKTSGQKNQKKSYYSNTLFHNDGEWEKTYEPRNTLNIMIQSCLRVSYTSPKIMHWITKLLKVLVESKNEFDLVNFELSAEQIAKDAVENDFLKNGETNNYNMGVNTPHIVLNYLDYLIWKNDKSKYKDFVFEFRNSVEHWYPQHPSDGTFSPWLDGVDTFGNLCIIQRNVNSKFSNMAPEAKKSTYGNMISKGSLKLRIMAELTKSCEEWKDKTCSEHEQQMIEILKNDIKKIN